MNKYSLYIEVELEADTQETAEQEADSLVLMPKADLEYLIGLLDGSKLLREGETRADSLNHVKQWLD